MLFGVLGPIEVHTHRLAAGKPATVLATLLLEPGAWVTVDRLVESVWPGGGPASAVPNLRTYVWQLRRLLPAPERLQGRADAYRIEVAPGDLDTDVVTRLAADARGTDPQTAISLLERALGLWRGRPFSGVPTPAADAAVARLDELRLDLREHLADRLLEAGRGRDAVAILRQVTTDAPLREAAWARLVRTLHATGQRTEALVAYRRAGDRLETELGVAPGPGLAAAGSVALGEPARPRRARRELPRDVRLVGRADELTAIRRGGPLVLVDGMRGAGKTALVVHAAHRMAADHPDGQLFVELRGSLPAADALVRLLRGIGVPATDIPDGLDDRAALWRSETSHRRLLVVLDDVADEDQLSPLLPATAESRTVVTTRNRGWHPAHADRIAVEPLDRRSAAALFAAAAGTPAGASVIRHCGGLPAALIEAAARLRSRPQWTVGRLASELDQDACRILTGTRRRLDGCRLAAWHALGSLPAEFGVPVAARTLGVSPAAARASLDVLVDRGLLDAAGPDGYRTHVLVRHLAGCAAGPLELVA